MTRIAQDITNEEVAQGIWEYLRKHGQTGNWTAIKTRVDEMNEKQPQVVVWSARALSADLQKEISQTVKVNYKVEVNEFEVDKELIGGFILAIGDRVIDLSIRNRIEAIVDEI